jgi:stearoyl-CoA desaturase (Delta-9 desaturase)
MSVTESKATSPPDAIPDAVRGPRWVVCLFLLTPLFALLVALPIALRGWITWLDVGLGLAMYAITALGITIGFHRYFTHGAFKATRGTRAVLAVTGSMAVEGSVADWVADHRKHHANSDKEGDPHSPWRFGTSTRDVAKGLWYAHMGWMLEGDPTEVGRYAPDIARDPITKRVSALFPMIVVATLLIPTLLGGLLTMSWQGALTAFFWAGLVRIALVHQITWSINSVCHVWGKHPFKSRDHAGNVSWLAVPSFGESWHNYHHADPTSARHGVLRFQVDPSAVLIRGMEKAQWVDDVRWPTAARVRARLVRPDEKVAVKRTLPDA